VLSSDYFTFVVAEMFGVPLEVLRLREQSTVPALVIRTVDRILALCRKLGICSE